MRQDLRHNGRLVSAGMDHDPARELCIGQVTSDFLPVAVLSVRKPRIHETQIMIEKDNVEVLGRKDLERFARSFGRADTRQPRSKPGNSLFCVIEHKHLAIRGN